MTAPHSQRRFGWRMVAGTLEGGTLPRALLMAALIFGAGVVFAAFWAGGAPRHPMDAYLRMGRNAGAEALRRDLSALSPAGQDAGPAVQRLIALGFTCQAPGGTEGAWRCHLRRPLESRRMLDSDAVLTVAEGRMTGMAVTMREGRLP
ncbi:hypothetical protein ACI6QG_07795 [Roseococcus sp. DSY-14]|uniref:hypothetical protein n=1 Tax=Roseococcus sp. DSY-14 TaxID=3369650 RepID=UPI00387B30CC